MSNDIKRPLTRQESGVLAGKAAAAKMTPQQRKERAIKANSSKKCMQKYPRATHVGELVFGDFSISCAVLPDGTRVITEKSVFEALGRVRTGRKTTKNTNDIDKGGKVPAFLESKNLIPFIPNSLIDGANITVFIHSSRGKAYGHKAESIPEICKVYLDARRAGVLVKSQLAIADRAEIILQALAKTGIIALVDEATGFERDKENDELQKLFSKFIAIEIQPWIKRFPPDFFTNLKKMYGLEHLKGNPQFAGTLINKFIYRELSTEIHEELRRRNPINEKGYRNNRHHQLLTHDIGCPALEKQIAKVNTLMSVSDNKEQFDALYEKTKRAQK